jgi:hypothetical protein
LSTQNCRNVKARQKSCGETEVAALRVVAIFITWRWKTAPSSKMCIKAAGHRDPGTTKLYDRSARLQSREGFFSAYWLLRTDRMIIAGASLGFYRWS